MKPMVFQTLDLQHRINCLEGKENKVGSVPVVDALTKEQWKEVYQSGLFSEKYLQKCDRSILARELSQRVAKVALNSKCCLPKRIIIADENRFSLSPCSDISSFDFVIRPETFLGMKLTKKEMTRDHLKLQKQLEEFCFKRDLLIQDGILSESNRILEQKLKLEYRNRLGDALNKYRHVLSEEELDLQILSNLLLQKAAYPLVFVTPITYKVSLVAIPIIQTICTSWILTKRCVNIWIARSVTLLVGGWSLVNRKELFNQLVGGVLLTSYIFHSREFVEFFKKSQQIKPYRILLDAI